MPQRKDDTSRQFDIQLGQRLRLFRQSVGLRQADLAERLGVSPQMIDKYEHGLAGMSAARLVDASHALNLPVSLLLDLPEHEGPDDDALAPSLRQARTARGLTQQALATQTGVSQQQIALVEGGKRALTVGLLTRIAAALDRHPWSLIDAEMFVASAEEQQLIEGLREERWRREGGLASPTADRLAESDVPSSEDPAAGAAAPTDRRT
jgi:transcriptional regulator with XRE-family HTH domain